MRKIFVSYHCILKDGSANGFGNYIGEFNSEGYADDPAAFIRILQETIANEVKELKGVDAEINILFFR